MKIFLPNGFNATVGGMLPAVGSDKATAAEGGIAPDVMFICHTAGGEGI